ncbi:hypothetical protein [Propionivibrio limicola]|uniref:hypothetical protein n=1 Tax=Propionivibrio limicola TaxID=167645 RepID=UPI0012910F4F|nr:hypothetical protein [Propionivibrio limicola]
MRKFEFAISIAVVGVLALLLARALERVREDFEEAAVQSEAAAIRIELLDRIAHHQAVGGELPASGNPLVWIGRRPPNYLGEIDGAPPASSGDGVWFYDRVRGELAYRFRSGREARFRLVDGPQAANARASLSGIGLQRVEEWCISHADSGGVGKSPSSF